MARLRSLTPEERGEMILAACRAASLIEQGRVRSGLAPARPVPWPPSTLEFLRRHAPNARGQ